MRHPLIGQLWTESRSQSSHGVHLLTSIEAWIRNHVPIKGWGEITYPFPNFNGATVEVWKWISNFIPQFTMDVITYQC